MRWPQTPVIQRFSKGAPPQVSSPGSPGCGISLVAPQLFAVLRVVAGDVAAMAGDLAGAARDDHAVGDDRAAGILDVEIAAAIALPHALAGAGVEPDDEIVPGREDDVVAIERDAALALAVVAGNCLARRQRMAVFPDQIAGGGIDRLDHVARIAEIHDAVMDDGRDLVEARAPSRATRRAADS